MDASRESCSACGVSSCRWALIPIIGYWSIAVWLFSLLWGETIRSASVWVQCGWHLSLLLLLGGWIALSRFFCRGVKPGCRNCERRLN